MNKKLWLKLMCIFVCASTLFFACAPPSSPSLPPLNSSPQEDTPTPQSSSTAFVLALVSTQSRLDTAYGQAVWQAISRFGGENSLNSAVYKAEDGDSDAALSTLELAVTAGAKLVVSMGQTASSACHSASVQNLHPNISYIFLDIPHNLPTPQNAVSVFADPVSVGWLAGNAAVLSGLSQLACLFPSNENPAQKNALYTIGFIMGAQDAAAKLPADTPVNLKAIACDIPGENPENKQGENPNQTSESGPASQIPPLAQTLLMEKPQLVFSTLSNWQISEEWFKPAYGTKVVAPLCQEDVPTGRLWALVEMEPSATISALLSGWKNSTNSMGTNVFIGPQSGALKLVSGFGTTTQTSLDAAALSFNQKNSSQEISKTAAQHLANFPNLNNAAFPNITLQIFPRDTPKDPSLQTG